MSSAPKVTEEVLTEGLEASKTWIRESIEMQRELEAMRGKLSTAEDDALERMLSAAGAAGLAERVPARRFEGKARSDLSLRMFAARNGGRRPLRRQDMRARRVPQSDRRLRRQARGAARGGSQAAPKAREISKGHCFSFNGNQYCE